MPKLTAVTPTDIPSYIRWLKSVRGVAIDDRTAANYRVVATETRDSFIASPFWTRLIGQLSTLDQAYQIESGGYPLFTAEQLATPPQVLKKSWESFLLKSFRWNILDNAGFSSGTEPSNGWLLPENWYSRVNDIVRTTLVVKYLDGVDFLLPRLQEMCTSLSGPSHVNWHAQDEGYYAAHLYTSHQVAITDVDWSTRHVEVPIEIQVTTQLQENIRALLHKFYEERRERPATDPRPWQWHIRGDDFVPNYLGHILHYLEGMILSVREEKTNPPPRVKRKAPR